MDYKVDRDAIKPNIAHHGLSFLRFFGGRVEETWIKLLDLQTRQVSLVPGSEELWSPRWSPDGRYICAAAGNELRLFDFTTQRWTELTQQFGAWQRWSPDGKHIYFSRNRSFFRMRTGDGKIEWEDTFKDLRPAPGSLSWVGWTPDYQPLMLRDVGTQDIYALELQLP